MIAQALLEAADRGVKIDITKTGTESAVNTVKKTRLHVSSGPSLYETGQIRILNICITEICIGSEKTGTLIRWHCRCADIQIYVFTAKRKERKDHSKFYIFDDEILIFGGINIEDKENGTDRIGRTYRDYMVQLCGSDSIAEFKAYRSGIHAGYTGVFVHNIKSPVRQFEVRDAYLDLIRNAKKELTILMAYFSPIPDSFMRLNRLPCAALRYVF